MYQNAIVELHMHIIQPRTYQPRPVRKPKLKRWFYLAGLLVLLAGYNYIRPLPAATATFHITGLSNLQTPSITWPSTEQAAIGAPGYGVLASAGNQQPLATASTAKVIAALCVLQKQPLKLGESGPTYTVSTQDVALYNDYVAGNGSVAAVSAGEKLTEYQALQAIMLPSADNIADSLVNWVFGSHDNYATYAASFLADRGITQTTIGNDASGYDSSTTSSATDLTKIGLLALKSPVLMEIAGQKSAVLPVAGVVRNYNTALGTNGITGLKTGNNDEDPGAFLFTADVPVGSKQVTVTGAVMGAPSLRAALAASTELSASLQNGFEETPIAAANQQVGVMHTAWGAQEPIITGNALQIVRWKDTAISETHTIKTLLTAGAVGSVQLQAPSAKATTGLRLQHAIPGPSFWWRLTRH
jgi:D-alanyl-D-alanine carboxypeptidase (penicillin-binding protein 5/6)